MAKAERSAEQITQASPERKGRAIKRIAEAALARLEDIEPDPTIGFFRKRVTLVSPAKGAKERIIVELEDNPKNAARGSSRRSTKVLTIQSEVFVPSLGERRKAYSIKLNPRTVKRPDIDAEAYVYRASGLLDTNPEQHASQICTALRTWEETRS